MKHFISTSSNSYLDLILKLFDLSEGVIKLHLKVVTLKNDCLQVHLLLANHILLEFYSLLLYFLNVFDLFGAALLELGHSAEELVDGLIVVIQELFSGVSHILHNIHLLLQVCDLFVSILAMQHLLLRQIVVNLLKDKNFGREFIALLMDALDLSDQDITLLLQLA